MAKILFKKMHGCGNDFVIIDNRYDKFTLTKEQIRFISNRNIGVGCDQLILIENSIRADCKIIIYNNDGSTSGACGNATRCVGKIIIQEKNKSNIIIETIDKILSVSLEEELLRIGMGIPSFIWNEIPLSKNFDDTLNLPIETGILKKPSAVNMGNPHMVFFTENIDIIDLKNFGNELENHEYFPDKANITVAEIISNNLIKIKTWERGAGMTLACGTAACASFAAAYFKNLVNTKAVIKLCGGDLDLEYSNGEIFMTGPATLSFTGIITI